MDRLERPDGRPGAIKIPCVHSLPKQFRMNKPSFFLLIILLAPVYVQSQSISRDSLAGVWICQEAMLPEGIKVPKEEIEMLNSLSPAIVNSKFLFKPNGLFEWQFQKNAPAVFQDIDFLRNQKWSIDKQDVIHIGDPRENLMQIAIREKAGTVYFIIADTPLLLRMRKE